jgi:hypothetical protein
MLGSTRNLYGRLCMFYGSSPTPYLSVEDAAAMLRVSAWTLYRNLQDVPHIRVGSLIKVRCEWLFLEPPARFNHQTYHPQPHQDTLPFDVKPVRVWRNTGKPVMLDPFGYPMKENHG